VRKPVENDIELIDYKQAAKMLGHLQRQSQNGRRPEPVIFNE
jgi:hypothetical protein